MAPDFHPDRSDHETPFAAHPSHPLIEFAGYGTFCDCLRATTIRDHAHSRLQVVATGPGADFDFRWRIKHGRWQRIELKGENVLLIPPGMRHEARWRRRAGIASVLVEEETVIAVGGRPLLKMISCLPCRRYIESSPLIGELCAELWRECQQSGPPNAAIIAPLGAALASLILRTHFAPLRNGDPQQWLLVRTKLADVRDHVERNPAENHSLKNLAAVAGLNPSYFGQLFRAATGLPPKAYVQGVRVRQARELLRVGKHSATTVAHMVGFTSHQMMNGAFRRVLGAVPSDYMPGGEKNHSQIERIWKRGRWRFC